MGFSTPDANQYCVSIWTLRHRHISPLPEAHTLEGWTCQQSQLNGRGSRSGAYGRCGYRDCRFRPQGRPFRAPVVAAGPDPSVWSSLSKAAWYVYRTRVQFSMRAVTYESTLDQKAWTNPAVHEIWCPPRCRPNPAEAPDANHCPCDRARPRQCSQTVCKAKSARNSAFSPNRLQPSGVLAPRF